ncbi:unnamed protein product [Rhizoctonia solani]|uniref:Uncharacterized protein n=1 Tax=Rhizoctonia solani TaxID=456999 RepID=A0A8H3E1K1_9AGAM|nr:unnamed protein product [Rhizoctonia solani]
MAESPLEVDFEQYDLLIMLGEKLLSGNSEIQTYQLTGLIEDIVGKGNEFKKLRSRLLAWLESSQEEKDLFHFPPDIRVLPGARVLEHAKALKIGFEPTLRETRSKKINTLSMDEKIDEGGESGLDKQAGETQGKRKPETNGQDKEKVGNRKRQKKIGAKEAPAPGTKYNSSMKVVNGQICGQLAQFPLEESDVAFTNDVVFGTSHIFSHTIANWRVINEDGEDVNILPSTPLSAKSKLYLLGVCGALNVETESGQRLALGWWLPDPDPEKRKWKASVEILWLRIRLTGFRPTALNFREENVTLMVAYGEKAQYILQSPHPEYAFRWEVCSEKFSEFDHFVDGDLTGARPSWFEDQWWTDVTKEHKEWVAKDSTVLRFQPASIPQVDRQVIKAEVNLAVAQGALERHEGLNAKDHRAIQALESSRPTHRRRTIGEQNISNKIKAIQACVDHRANDVREAESVVSLWRQKLDQAQKSKRKQRAKLAPLLNKVTESNESKAGKKFEQGKQGKQGKWDEQGKQDESTPIPPKSCDRLAVWSSESPSSPQQQQSHAGNLAWTSSEFNPRIFGGQLVLSQANPSKANFPSV